MQDWGGVPGGYGEASMKALVNIAKKHQIKEVFYEKNYGNGALEAVIRPYFQVMWPVTLTEHWATGQKEKRIIDVLEPLISSHRMIFHPDAIANDLSSVERYGDDIKKTYSGLFQMSMITEEKDCLVHDDRLDALAGAVFQVTAQVAFDNESEMDTRRARENLEWMEKMRNPSLYREDVDIGYEETTKTLASFTAVSRH